MSRSAPGSPDTPATWVSEATAWVDGRLAGLGCARTGPVDVVRSRPWGRVARIATTAGPVWLKVPAPRLWFELALVTRLGGLDSPLVPAPLATDAPTGRLLLADQGRPFRDVFDGVTLGARFSEALVEVGRLQRAAAGLVPALVAEGVADLRPAAVTARVDELLQDATVPAVSSADRRRLTETCAALAASDVPASIDHNDLHDGNVMVDDAGRVSVLDWGDSVVAHPFAVLLVAEGVLAERFGGVAADHPAVTASRRAYLDVFADLAPGEDLEATARRAVAVACVGRAWVWQRALATFTDTGTPVPADWADAPATWLAHAVTTLRALAD